MNTVVIIGFARTPFGRFLGALKEVKAVDLGGIAIRKALERSDVPVNEVDYVLMGMVIQAGAGQVPSRQATIKAGLPSSVPSDTVNKVCASGLRAVNLAYSIICSGEANVVVAGGMENMSAAPHLVPDMRTGHRMGNVSLLDAMVHDGLWCPFHEVHMGVHGGKIVSAEYGVTREEMDYWALRSQTRAVMAIDNGKLAPEITPVEVLSSKGEPNLISLYELPRRDTSLDKLSKLPPVFEQGGTVTAGNAPGLSDGAAALVMTTTQKAEELGVKPLATIVSQAAVSMDPPYIAAVPAYAAEKALKKAGLNLSQIDLIEVNEAFASVALASKKICRWDEEKINVNGGAIAFGHPIGASGARILMTLITELQRRGGGYGLATICSGAAQGEATIVKVN